MQKREMTEEQLKDREAVIHILSGAGWQGRTTNDLFDQGFRLRSEAVMDYRNGKSELIVQYSAEEEDISLTINQGAQGLEFIIKLEGKLQRLLDIIIQMQDDIDLNNYRQHIRKIMEEYAEVYVVWDGEIAKVVD